MGETTGAGSELPAETIAGALPEEDLEVVEVIESDQTELEQRIYEAIIKNRTMALGLTMAGARTRDGLYTAWAYNATANAGLYAEILRRQNTENSRRLLERLNSNDAAKEQNAGTRQVF